MEANVPKLKICCGCLTAVDVLVGESCDSMLARAVLSVAKVLVIWRFTEAITSANRGIVRLLIVVAVVEKAWVNVLNCVVVRVARLSMARGWSVCL